MNLYEFKLIPYNKYPYLLLWRKEWLPPYTTADDKMRGVAALPHFTNYNDNEKF